ncbi:class I SAM-dependent methyltransferase [Amycolatopsis sp.]|uniref:class I SAM-dependent methyltransferase n=1 Tax=Amycolatopsis sp. TaxID=37632 RepID=UPI00261231F0|nr:class I SAM-dependent methyltransferase [Amycolatopsis sp.]
MNPTASSVRKSARRVVGRGLHKVARKFSDPYVEELNRIAAELREEIVRQGDRCLDRVVEFEIRTRRDMIYAGDLEAAAESNRFASEFLRSATPFARPQETLANALLLAPAGGMALEFGVATGNTLRVIAESRGGKGVFGFDWFQGLPEDWINGMPAGSFARPDPPDVPGAELVVGLFADSLPGFLDTHPGDVYFLHVDGDLYSSAKTVLDLVGPRLRPGSIVHFDEFFNYPGWQQHEHKAWLEYVERTGVEFEYVAYTYADNQVTVRIGG